MKKIMEWLWAIVLVMFACFILLIMFIATFTSMINRPNFTLPPKNFQYSSYNNDVEIDNITNGFDRNYNKIGYVMNGQNDSGYKYKLVFNDEDDYVYIYPTQKQDKLFRQIGDSKLPVIVEVKIIDTYDSDYYGLEIVNIVPNEEPWNKMCTHRTIIIFALIALVIVFIILLVIREIMLAKERKLIEKRKMHKEDE